MKKLIVLIVGLCYSLGSTAQMNDPLYDLNQKVHFGFSVIGTYGKLKLAQSPTFFDKENDTLNYISTTSFPGLGVGGIMNFHLNEDWDLRTMVIVQVMSQRNLTYHFKGNVTKTALLQSTYFELPLLLKYKSKRRKNFRFYVIGGAGYRYNFTNDADTERSETKPVVGLNANTFHYDVGFGFDLYYPYFKFSPEIKLSNDIFNALVKDNYIYTRALNGIYPKLIQFSLHFE
ncbi:MAG: PorT family protein [Flavobacteriales bacterium]|nr:PorT family protein [Flavobacteriales bacterium]